MENNENEIIIINEDEKTELPEEAAEVIETSRENPPEETVSEGITEEVKEEIKEEKAREVLTTEPPVYTVPPVVNKEVTAPKTQKKNTAVIALCAAALMVLSGIFGGYVGAKMVADKLSAAEPSVSQTEEKTTFYQTTRSYNDLSARAEKASRSVVSITVERDVIAQSWFQNYSYTQTGAGSGVIISSDGYILTCNHVVEDADRVYVEIGEKKYEATVIGNDSLTDIAVIKIEADEELTPATLGNSDDIRVGSGVMAIGNPLGLLSNSVCSGIISAINRDITIENTQMTLIQTDAAVSPGNSGGGLFDMNGNLIGIVNAKYTDDSAEGLGFAIPINTAVKVAEDIVNNGYVASRATLGVTIVEGSSGGIYVYTVVEGSAAEEAGLQYGDKIIAVDNTEFTSTSDLTSYISKCSPGQEITIIIVRDGHMYEVKAVLKEASATHDNSNTVTNTNPGTENNNNSDSDATSGRTSNSQNGSNPGSGTYPGSGTNPGSFPGPSQNKPY